MLPKRCSPPRCSGNLSTLLPYGLCSVRRITPHCEKLGPQASERSGVLISSIEVRRAGVSIGQSGQVRSVQSVCRCIVGVLVHLSRAIVQILDQVLAVRCQRFRSVHISTMPALCSVRCRQSSGSRSGSGLPMVSPSHPQHLGPMAVQCQ